MISAVVAAVVAAETAGGAAYWQPFLNLGAIGVGFVALGIFAKSAYQREVKRADAAEAALIALQAKVIDIYAPAAERMAIAVADFVAESRRDRR